MEKAAMTDTPAPSILDRIKAAMGTYEVAYQVSPDEGWIVHRRTVVALAEACGSEDESEAHALDLNARAVIDAIVGALRWRDQSPEPFSHVVCEFAGAHVGAIGNWGAILGCAPGGMSWRSFSLVAMEWHATESEAKTAVEAAFEAALVGE